MLALYVFIRIRIYKIFFIIKSLRRDNSEMAVKTKLNIIETWSMLELMSL